MNRIAGAQAKAVAVGHVHHIRIGGIIRHLNTVNNTSEEVIKLRLLNDLDLNGIRFFLVGHSHRLLSRRGVVKSRHRETLGDDLATVIVIGNCNTELQFIAGIARRFSRLYGNRHDVLFHHWLRVLQRRIAAPIVLECAAKGGGKLRGLHVVSGFEVTLFRCSIRSLIRQIQPVLFYCVAISQSIVLTSTYQRISRIGRCTISSDCSDRIAIFNRCNKSACALSHDASVVIKASDIPSVITVYDGVLALHLSNNTTYSRTSTVYCTFIRTVFDPNRNAFFVIISFAQNTAHILISCNTRGIFAIFDLNIICSIASNACYTFLTCCRDTACGDHILHHGAARQFAEQADIGCGSGDIQRHGVAVAVKGAGKVVGIRLGDRDVRCQLIAAAGLHLGKFLRGADILHRACRSQHRRRAAAAGRPGHRHFLSRLLLLLRLLILGRDGVLRVRRSYLFLPGLLLLIRGQRVGQHGGGQQADDHHDGQQPAYDSLPHISFSFM